jgi:signal transduction histidine kinase
MLARGDGSAPPLNREPLDAQELVESVADQMRPAAKQKGLRVVVRGDGRLTFDADEDLTLQLLLNLADNAVKYTPQGEVTIGWRGSPAPSLYVADTGAGIAPEQRERIFERFHRGGDARSAVEGVGLGLAISRWIADAHGWTIEVSGDGAGTTFTVHLGADDRAKDSDGRAAI